MTYVLLLAIFSTNWLGIYLKGEKVGYTQIVTREIEGGYEVTELTNMKLSMMGMERGLKSVVQYEVASDYTLNSFTFSLETESQTISSSGEVSDKELNMSIKTGGTVQPKTIPIKGPVYPVTVLPMIASGFTETPKEIDVFDPSIMSVNPATCKLLNDHGDSIEIEIKMLGATSTAWISQDGILLSEAQPMSIFMKKESQEEALKVEAVSPEVLSLYGVPSNVKIDNPRSVKLLKLIPKGKFLTTNRQRWYGDTLLIQVLGPSKGKRIDEYLEPTPFIQCKDQRIVDLAHKIVKFAFFGTWKKVVKLTNWVSENVVDRPSVTIPSALDVLKTKEGDCGEHSILFVALARAIGIPARVVVGLVYNDGGFYYHAWAKVWVGRWVEVDPTFNQPIADATHIALAEGELEEQAKIMDLIDKIELEVVEYK